MAHLHDLPIDVVPGSRPRRFRWRQWVDSIVGPRYLDMEGVLPQGVDVAVMSLIDQIKTLCEKNAELVKRCAALTPDAPAKVSIATPSKGKR